MLSGSTVECKVYERGRDYEQMAYGNAVNETFLSA
jgi:hypothetical protein